MSLQVCIWTVHLCRCKMKLTIGLVVLLHYMLHLSDAYRILGVFTMASYSHYIAGNRLMKELAERGHDVTIITPYKEKNPPKSYRQIYLEGMEEEGESKFSYYLRHCITVNAI